MGEQVIRVQEFRSGPRAKLRRRLFEFTTSEIHEILLSTILIRNHKAADPVC